ncbi:RNA-directed DNA polymerase, eukaryota, Reverse transcriptase zinc-binding domain protein [Artemisia annua]|uniref:RNA-directed DNA polymerase, eukaryota, Reverse transcriptase zinc-binding domain protein n=1 Tax=Artemisia annua TaxID=35608 RepID=A0A2U1QCA3_ARTAN|nr:RNA-directed DNA polymerase, eukaryota, Reverse transcriptase zinc-binding domain protein [Artemisia annua]
MTRERCLRKDGKIDFARVLVEVNANEDLPSVLEIEYPPLGNRPARVRPRTTDEVAAKSANLNNNVDIGSKSNDMGKSQVDDGFVIVGKNNKPVVAASSKKESVQNRNTQGRSGHNSFPRNADNKQSNSFCSYGKGGNVRSGNGVNQVRIQPNPKSNSGGSKLANQGDDSLGKNLNNKDKLGNNSSKELCKDPNFKPKVLIRGSSSKNSSDIAINESIPINNSYQVLEDVDMEQSNLGKDVNEKEEFFNSVWPDDDVKFEKDGIANDIKPEYDPVAASDIFPLKIWNIMKNLVKLSMAPNCWTEIQDFMLRRPINKSVWSILQRLLTGASIYYIWQESNLRTFQGKARSIDDICYLIQDVVRLRILGLNLSDSDQVLEAAQIWDFHVERVISKKKIKFSDGRKNS